MSSYLECKSDDSKQALREQVEAKLQEARLEEEQLRSQLYHPSWAPDALKSATTTQLEHALAINASRIAALERALALGEDRAADDDGGDGSSGFLAWPDCSACMSPFGSQPDPSAEALSAALAVTPVWLHVYDVGHAKAIQRVDKVVQDWLGVGGIFHGAVEVYGHEWSFGATRRPATGVFCCAPRGCPMHTYRQSIYMGDCGLSAQEARKARAPPAEKRRASHAPVSRARRRCTRSSRGSWRSGRGRSTTCCGATAARSRTRSASRSASARSRRGCTDSRTRAPRSATRSSSSCAACTSSRTRSRPTRACSSRCSRSTSPRNHRPLVASREHHTN